MSPIVRTCERCGGSFVASTERAVYCSDVCRARAWKERVGYGRRRNSRPRPSGLQVSYHRAVEAVAAELARATPFFSSAHPNSTRQWAERILRPALPRRQREQLERRGRE